MTDPTTQYLPTTVADSTTDYLPTTASNATHDDYAGASSPATPIFFAFISCALGALIRTCLKQVPVRIPYTVIVLVLGAIMGVLADNLSTMNSFTKISDMNPHTILHAFLPVLIFESAFAMEAHMFMKSLTQILFLAVPGLCFASFLTAVFAKYTFDYQWSWTVAMMFGSIISATDPVSVVALLKELGTSKHLTVLVEGESLLNDGAAIVLFEVFQQISIAGSMTVGEITFHFFMKALVGPLYGFIMAKITVFWLVNIFNDALTEITITLASTYVTFYIGEEVLQVSGVMAVVVLGITLSAERTSISPEVETFLHRFWEMLAYLANTLIFILVGVVIMKKAIQSVDGRDWVYCFSLFVAVTFIRALMIILLSPILVRTGYGLTWRNATVMIWGGLRGAVGLAMALMVSHKTTLDPTGQIQNRVLFHSAGIVMFTLLLNATTISVLLKLLGMSEESIPKRITMATAFRNLCDVKNSGLALYQTDRFLADADWDIVKKYTELNNPYESLEDMAEWEGGTRHSICPKCDSQVPCQPSKKEADEMKNESRLRLLKAQKISYWKQFEHGMLSRDAVRRLVECVDAAVDKDEALLNIDDVKNSWEIKGAYPYFKMKLEMWDKKKPSKTIVQSPENRILKCFYKVAVHRLFDWLLNVIILLNVVAIAVEIALQTMAECERDYYISYHHIFTSMNYGFIVIYTVEAFIKVTGMRKQYFRSPWNLFDFAILLMSYVDTVLDVTIFKQVDDSEESADEDCDAQNVAFSPSLLKVVKAVRFLRLLRSLRLVKGLLPQLITVVNKQINKKLRFGYDVGKGYITSEEEVLHLVDFLVENKDIAADLKNRIECGRIEIMKELGRLQKEHPGIAVSVKSQHAARRILNTLRDKVTELRGEGVLDDMEASRLELMIEIRMKKLLKFPSTIQPPPPEKIIGNLSWCMNDPILTEYIKHNATLVSMPEGEKLTVEEDPEGGIYVVISGLVKVEKLVAMVPSRREQNVRKQSFFPTIVNSTTECSIKSRNVGRVETVRDYLTTGSLLGEMALLTKHPEHDVDITCDTSVQMYYISYDAIQAALELFTEEPSLEFRLWRVCSIRITAGILRHIPYYRSWPQERIKLHLENASMVLKHHVIPEGTDFVSSAQHEVFNTNFESMSDVVLIHGEAQDEVGDLFIGPCLIPQRVDYILLIQGRTESHVIVVAPRDSSYVLDLGRRASLESHGVHPLMGGSEHNAYVDHLTNTSIEGLRRRSSVMSRRKSSILNTTSESADEVEIKITSNQNPVQPTVAFNLENEVRTIDEEAPVSQVIQQTRLVKMSTTKDDQLKDMKRPIESKAKGKVLPLDVADNVEQRITPVESPSYVYRPSSTEQNGK